MARQVDALLIASTQWTVEAFRRVEEARIPYILLDRNFAGLPANFVGVDDVRVGTMATEHLIEIGCRNIAHIGGRRISTASGRLLGYKQALAAHGLVCNPEYIVMDDRLDESTHVEGYDAARKLLALNPRPDGIFCFNDPISIGAMGAILDAGLSIPADVALVGCANLHYDPFLRVPLTSVDQQSVAIGQRAAKTGDQVDNLRPYAAVQDHPAGAEDRAERFHATTSEDEKLKLRATNSGIVKAGRTGGTTARERNPVVRPPPRNEKVTPDSKNRCCA